MVVVSLSWPYPEENGTNTNLASFDREFLTVQHTQNPLSYFLGKKLYNLKKWKNLMNKLSIMPNQL